MDGRGCLLALCCLGSAGCRTTAVPPYPKYLESSASQPIAGPNAFDDYVSAAEAAERASAKYLKRTNFTPGQRDMVVRQLAGPMARIAGAGAKPCAFRFEPARPFEIRPYRSGWRLLGLAYGWRIERLAKDERFDEAIRTCLIATRFGFDLTGGDCADASLGYAIVDGARLALLRAFPDLSARQLRTLSSGIDRALQRSPGLESTLENERLNMLAAVDAIQIAYRESDFKPFAEELRQDIQPAIKHLQAISPNDPIRAEYFDALAQEANAATEDYIGASKLNARQRRSADIAEFKGDRPWRRWSRFFFLAPKGLFPIRDRTLAWTRLFALHSLLRADTKGGAPPPKGLRGYPPSLRVDPFSGEPFVYSSTPTSYELYSVGADFRDDGGETDEAYMSPDLALESRSL